MAVKKRETRGRPKSIITSKKEYCAFGKWLGRYCERYSIAKVDIYNELGTSYDVIKSWLIGAHNPRVVNLIQICEIISKRSSIHPMILLDEAILTFGEMIGAVKRHHYSTEINPDKEQIHRYGDINVNQ